MDLLNEIGSETESHLNTVETLMLLFIHELDVADDVAKWSRFHDIGKRDIPKEILYKEGQLTLAERKMVEKHPMLGLKYIGLLTKEKKEQTWLESLIGHHHERWDGHGYPFRLKGEDIPFEARCLTIIDQYDALRTERCYKRGWGHEEVLHYFQSEKGAIFDPHLVEHFLQKEKEMAKAYKRLNS